MNMYTDEQNSTLPFISFFTGYFLLGTSINYFCENLILRIPPDKETSPSIPPLGGQGAPRGLGGKKRNKILTL